MKVTVCQLRNSPQELMEDWGRLAEHVGQQQSDFLLLPEMPFCPWVAHTRQVDRAVWQTAVEQHEQWNKKIETLGVPIVTGSRPIVEKPDRRLNQGFVWESASGVQGVHLKHYLPDEAGFWEASWYQPGALDFGVSHTSQATIGFLICTELWFTRHAREYAKQGIQLLLCPRVTPQSSIEMWTAGGQAAAIVSGAYCLSSNLVGPGGSGVVFGGAGWVIEPEYGRIVAQTTEKEPFVTVTVNLTVADDAKHTYPRYVKD